MKVDIKDLGYVKNVSLDLDKDLTILCGPNNTGKTYVAYAIYGLMRFRSEITNSRKINEEFKNLMDKGQIELNVLDLLTENNSNYLDAISKRYVKQISKVFASDDSTFEKTEIKILLGDVEKLKTKILSQKISQEFGIRNSLSVKIVKEKNSTIITCLLIEKEIKDNINRQEIPTSVLLDFISHRIFTLFLDFIFPNTYEFIFCISTIQFI